MEALHLFPILLVMAGLLLASAFFSATETAVIALGKIRVRHLVDRGSRSAKILYNVLLHFEDFITAVLVCNNVVNTAIAAMGTLVFVNLFGERAGLGLTTLVMAFAILVFGEITPKIYAARHAERVALAGAWVFAVLLFLLTPVTRVLVWISNQLLVRMGSASKRTPLVTEEELRTMIEVGKEEGVFTDDERKMLQRIFRFDETHVREVMTPLARMIAVSRTASADELVEARLEEGKERLPVYEGTQENIVGVIYAKDILYLVREGKLFTVEDIIHPVYKVPPAKRVNELLKDFQRNKIQIAVVEDKPGHALGLVTLEDLLEEIVGEIEEDPSKSVFR